MSNNDSALYVLRYNEVSAALEAQIGLNWTPITITVEAAPGGSNGQIQFNDSNAFGGDSGLTFNSGTNTVTTGTIVADAFKSPAASDGNITSVDGAININSPRGLLLPLFTTTERDAIATPDEGLTLYNTTTHTINFYNGSAWTAV